MRQQRVDVTALVHRRACQDVLQIGEWIASPPLRRADQARNGGRAQTRTQRSNEQPRPANHGGMPPCLN